MAPFTPASPHVGDISHSEKFINGSLRVIHFQYDLGGKRESHAFALQRNTLEATHTECIRLRFNYLLTFLSCSSFVGIMCLLLKYWHIREKNYF